jgi:alanyl-tRNA synthetase
LHAALRQVLGTHVMQKGSLVNEEVLRFDFSHFAKMTDEEIAKVESIVNAKIRENITLEEKRNVPISEAKSLGAMALFGEKYGDFVRVITFDKNYSVELCGGTHVKATGQIGLFKIVSESSIAAGVRRIEAVTASKAEEFVAEQAKILSELREMLKNPKDLLKAVSALSEEKAKLQKEIERLQAKEITAVKNELLGKITVKSGVNFLAERVEMPSSEALKTLSFQLKNQTENLFSVLVSEIEGKAHIAVMISENLTEEKSLDAAKIVKDLAALVQGGGGGQKFFATAAGKNPEGIEGVLVKCKGLV